MWLRFPFTKVVLILGIFWMIAEAFYGCWKRLMQTIFLHNFFNFSYLQIFMDTRRRKLKYSGRLTSGKVYPTLAQCVALIRSDLRWSDAIWPRTRAGWSRKNGKQGRAYTKWFIHSRLHMHGTMRFRQNCGRSLDVLRPSLRFDRGSEYRRRSFFFFFF